MYYNNHNIKYAREMRKKMTPWERKLWYCFLSKHSVRFYRQKPIENYIADFYCPKADLIIELDGGGHYEPEAMQYDQKRTQDLEKLGLIILRFCNLDIDRNFEGVCSVIDTEVQCRIKGSTLPQSR